MAVPGEQYGGCIFHVNIEHAVLAYGMPDPPVHVLDAKLCRPVSTGSISLPVWHKPFFILYSCWVFIDAFTILFVFDGQIFFCEAI